MRWLTHAGGARVTIGAGLLLMAAGEQLVGLAALFALTTSHVAVQLLKRVVARPRPCDANGHPLALIDLPDPFSFPSGHAAAACAVSGTIAIARMVWLTRIVKYRVRTSPRPVKRTEPTWKW